jgi:circadian clock protein KaiB
MAQFVFRLFVSGTDPRHERVALGLRRLLANKCSNHCHLEVVDVHRQPELAEQCNILATPTLVRLAPLPTLRVVGELAACTRILADLGLRPGEWPSKMETTDTEARSPCQSAGVSHA